MPVILPSSKLLYQGKEVQRIYQGGQLRYEKPAPRPAYADVVLAKNPIAYWKLDEAADATLGLDSSGRNNHATYVGARTAGPGIVRGSAKTINLGSGGYLTHNADDLKIYERPQLTMEAWIIPDTTGAALIYEQGGSGNGFAMYTEAGRVYAGGWASNTTYQAYASAPITAGNLYHVVGSFDNGTMRLDLNGVTAETVAGFSRPVPVHNSPGGIGRVNVNTRTHSGQTGSSTSDYRGSIGHVAVYVAALTQAQSLENYNSGRI